jgi:hypothetical protein
MMARFTIAAGIHAFASRVVAALASDFAIGVSTGLRAANNAESRYRGFAGLFIIVCLCTLSGRWAADEAIERIFSWLVV